MTVEPTPDVPDLLLEQYRLGELNAVDTERVQRLLLDDERARERLAALEQSDRDIAARVPSDALARRARERLTRTQPIRGRRRAVYVLASSVAGMVIVIALGSSWAGSGRLTSDDRIKGLAPSLTVFRRTPEGSETLADGAPARAGDLLRLGYVSAGRRYGVILSIDGRGAVTRHLPETDSHAAALQPRGTVLLDSAYELDDAPRWERFYFITSDQPFDVAAVEQAARAAVRSHPLALPDTLPVAPELEQFSFTVKKEVKS